VWCGWGAAQVGRGGAATLPPSRSPSRLESDENDPASLPSRRFGPVLWLYVGGIRSYPTRALLVSSTRTWGASVAWLPLSGICDRRSEVAASATSIQAVFLQGAGDLVRVPQLWSGARVAVTWRGVGVRGLPAGFPASTLASTAWVVQTTRQTHRPPTKKVSLEGGEQEQGQALRAQSRTTSSARALRAHQPRRPIPHAKIFEKFQRTPGRVRAGFGPGSGRVPPGYFIKGIFVLCVY